MPLRRPHQPRRLAACVVAALAAGCSDPEPSATVADLSWACGAKRCTASFRVEASADGDAQLLVLTRAYRGGTVAERRIVGEQRERTTVPAGQSRRFSVSVDTREPADRLRVVLEPAD